MRKILVVESDMLFAKKIIKNLENEYQIQLADNAVIAMQKIDESTPDLLIINYSLNGVSATVLFHELQSYLDLAKIKIFLLYSGLEMPKISDLKYYGVVKIFNKDAFNLKRFNSEIKAETEKA